MVISRRAGGGSWRARGVCQAVLCLLVLTARVPGQTADRSPRTFLTRHLAFTEKQFRQAEEGRPVVKSLETGLDREVAIFGIIRVGAGIETFLDQFRDIEQFERGAGVLQIRKISDPPLLSDFSDLTLPDDDLEALPRCRIGDCLMKVDEYALRRYQTEIDWSRPDAHAQANALTRQLLLEAVVSYQQGGNKALGQLRDQQRPTFIGDEFIGMLEHSPYLPEYVPELDSYLREYPASRPARVEEFFYWSKVNFGLRDTVRVNHVVVYRSPNATSDVAIASKMLYASHYFHTALDLRYLTQDPARPGEPGFYLMVLLRSRSDGLSGALGWMVRRRAVKSSTEGLASYLRSVKRNLERPR